MKRQIVTFLMVLALATGTALWAPSTGTTPQATPPSQQLDQSGQPETGTGPDVDVDAGASAEDGVMDVEVNQNADSDTEAQGNDPAVTTGTYADVDNDNDNLPETAGNGPLFALLGLLSLAGAFAVRVIR
ncbi:MAG TPA: hypothetical protein VF414_04865 [Thermoanaerobaculia bacterium]